MAIKYPAKLLYEIIATYDARACSNMIMNINSIRTDYTRKNAQVVTNLQASCNKSAIKPSQDLFALLVPSCCNKLLTSCYQLVTRLMTIADLLQVSSLLCWNKLVASLLPSSTLLQVDNNLSTTGNKQCEDILLTA